MTATVATTEAPCKVTTCVTTLLPPFALLCVATLLYVGQCGNNEGERCNWVVVTTKAYVVIGRGNNVLGASVCQAEDHSHPQRS